MSPISTMSPMRKREYESFAEFIDRHINKFKILFMIFLVISITCFGVGISCMSDNTTMNARGCYPTFMAGVCGTFMVIAHYMLKAVFYVYDTCRGVGSNTKEEEIRDCSIYDMV